MLRSDVDAEDVTQDVLLQVVRKLPSFRGESAFPTWLHRVTVNTALSHRRKQAVREERRVEGPLHAFLEDGRTGQPRPDRNAECGRQAMTRERRRQMERAIASLPEVYGKGFHPRGRGGAANQDVADAEMGLSLPAVKSRLHRARLLCTTPLPRILRIAPFDLAAASLLKG